MLYNTGIEKNMSLNSTFKLLGAYTIFNTVEHKDMYILKKLDELLLIRNFARDKLKKIHLWQQLQLSNFLNLSYKETNTLIDSLKTTIIAIFPTRLTILILYILFVISE